MRLVHGGGLARQIAHLLPVGICWTAGLLLLLATATKYDEFLVYGIEALLWKASISSMSQGLIASGSRLEILVLAMFLGFQVALGMWLISGIGRRAASLAALVLFSAFAWFSGQRWLSGNDTCGCFGLIQIQPWVMLIVDLFIVGGLAMSQYFIWKQDGMAQHAGRWRKTLLVLGIVAGVLLGAHVALARMDERGVALRGQDMIVLNPEVWPGKPFPLLEYLGNAKHLRVGRHILLFYRPGCDACERVKRHLQSTLPASDLARVVLVIAPSNAEDDAEAIVIEKRDQHQGLSEVVLQSDKTWVYPQPLVVEVADGVVTRLVDIPKDADAKPDTTEAKSSYPSKASPVTSIPVAQGFSHDFGFVEKAGISHIRFILVNDQDAPVQIRKVLPECTCIKVLGEHRSAIPAKGNAAIDFSFEAPDEATHYAKKIHVELSRPHADGKAQRYIETLQIKARVGLPLRVTAVRPVKEDEGFAEADILNEGLKPIRLVYSTSNVAGLTAMMPDKAIESGTTRAIRIKLPAESNLTADKLQKVHIHTNSKDQPVIDVVLNAAHE